MGKQKTKSKNYHNPTTVEIRRLSMKRNYMKEHDFTDPYPKQMVRFFKEVTFKNPIQARYLSEWGYDELKAFLKPLSNTKGEFLGFELDEKDKPAYVEAKKRLNIS